MNTHPKGWKEIEAGEETCKVYHTPTPWQVTHLRHGTQFTNAFRIGSGPFGEIARTSATAAEEENEANAQFICKAVNCHVELVDALKQIAGMAENGRESVSEIVGSRIGSGGRPSIHVDSAAAITRGQFLSIQNLAKAILKKAKGEL